MVPLHYLRNIHRDDFWDNIKADDATALHIQEIVGIFVTNPGAESDASGFANGSGEGEGPSDGPDSFRVAGDRGGDPSASKANESLAERTQRVVENRNSTRLKNFTLRIKSTQKL